MLNPMDMHSIIAKMQKKCNRKIMHIMQYLHNFYAKF